MSLSVPVNPPSVNIAVASPVSSGNVFNSLVSKIQVNQIKGITPNNSSGAGIPKQVSGVQVSIANAQQGSTCTVSVLFQNDPTDKSFSGINIWVKGYQGNSQLVQVASGTSSPAKFVLNNTGETVSFTIQAFGNGGNAPILSSPTSSAVLPKSKTGGFGSSAVVAYTATNPPPSTSTPTNGNIVLIDTFATSASAFSGGNPSTLIVRIPAYQCVAIGNSLKVSLSFNSSSTGNVPLLNSVVRRTLPGSTVFTDTTNLTWSGSVTPTFATGTTKTFTSDSCVVAIDGQHDIYIMLRISTSVSGSALMNNFLQSAVTKCCGLVGITAFDTVSSIPSMTTLMGSLTSLISLFNEIYIG